ncbi:MAG: virulence factor SrfC family protein [Symbiopectobacterium sp.]
MANWLNTEVKLENKLIRLSEQLHDMQNELCEHILCGWYQSDSEISTMRKQKVAKSVLKSLQTRPGVHSELLERMLPTLDELRHLYQQQLQSGVSHSHITRPVLDNISAITNTDPFDIGIGIDLFSDTPLDVTQTDESQEPSDVDTNAAFSSQVFRFWINHMRNLLDNAPLVELFVFEQTEAGNAGGRSYHRRSALRDQPGALHATMNKDDHHPTECLYGQ